MQGLENEKIKSVSAKSILNITSRETILNCVAEGVFAVDENKIICFFNKSAEKITGFSAKEAIGLPCRDVFRTGICSTNCTLKEVAETGKSIINRPVKIINRNGRPILISINAASLRNSKGKIIGGVETFRDLSDEENLKKKINKSFTFQDIISRNPRMHELFAILPDIAASEASVLIEGDSGTGKELFAKAIHNLSPRKKKPFIAVNCGSLPDTLLESELFGYKKGAFTDAKKDKPGRFELAREGSLFLDEIGDVSPALQVKLLRVLQEKVYEPLGATRSVPADVRVIAATNQRLLDKLKAGSFREDLYYRLNVLKIELPALQDRRSDIPLLIDYYRRSLNFETGKNIEALNDSALNILMGYSFPGNIRELENILQYAFVLCKNSIITPSHLPKELLANNSERTKTKPITLVDFEKMAIREALINTNGNTVMAARQLGIDPSTLYRKLDRYKTT